MAHHVKHPDLSGRGTCSRRRHAPAPPPPPPPRRGTADTAPSSAAPGPPAAHPLQGMHRRCFGPSVGGYRTSDPSSGIGAGQPATSPAPRWDGRHVMRILSRVMRGLLAALLLAGCLVTGSATANAAQPDCAGRGVPDTKISIQLWTFAEYIGFGTDAATIDRTREVFAGPERDRLPQCRAVHPERALRRGVPRPARRVRPQGVGAARQRRHPDGPRGHRRDHRGEPHPRHQVLRLRRHPELRDRGRVGRVRRVPRRRWAPRPACRASPSWSTTTTGSSSDVFGDQHRLRPPAGQHRPEERRLPARPVLGHQRRRRPGRPPRAVRQPDPALPRQGHGGRYLPRPHRDRR